MELTGAALLGCFLATWEPDGQPTRRESLNKGLPPQGARPRYCASADEVRMAIECGAGRLDSPVLFSIPFRKGILVSAPDRHVYRRGLTGYFTTAGRVLLNDLLPDELPFFDAPVGSDVARYLVEQTMELGETASVLAMVERLARFGFGVVTRRGYTLAASDFRPSQAKPTLVEAAWRNVAKAYKHYHRGVIAATERYNQVLDQWRHAQEQLGVEVMHTLFDTAPQPQPFRALVHSGAGINLRELRKLTGMVGPLPVGATLRSEIPVINSLAEGLTSQGYFRHARYERSLAVSHTLRQRQAPTGANSAANRSCIASTCGDLHACWCATKSM